MATSKETVTLTVNTATREFGKGLIKMVVDSKAALKLGGTLQEALALSTAALSDLLPVLKDLAELAPEAVADVEAELSTVFLTAKDLIAAIRG